MLRISLAILLATHVYAAETTNVARLGVESAVSPERQEPAAGLRYTGGLTYGGNQYVAVWTDFRSGIRNVYASRVRRDGTPIDTSGIRIGEGSDPDVAWSNALQSYLVVWVSPDGKKLLTQWIDVNGAFVGPQRSIPNPKAVPPSVFPRLASNGRDFIIAVDGRPGTISIGGAPFSPGPQGRADGPAALGLLDGSGNLKQWMTSLSILGLDYEPSPASDGNDFAVLGYSTTSRQSIFLRISASSGTLSGGSGPPNYADSDAVWTGDAYFLTSRNALGFLGGVFVDRAGNPIGLERILSSDAIGYPWASASAGDGAAVVVWNSRADISGARVSRNGVDASFPIAATADPEREPKLASDGSNFLVMYSTMPNTNYANYNSVLFSTLFSASGQVGQRRVLTQTAPKQSTMTSARLGDSTFAVWEEETGDRVSYLAAGRISDQGTLLAPALPRLIASPEAQRLPALASSGDQALLVWMQQTGDSYQLWASRIGLSGEVMDSTPQVISRQVLSLTSKFDNKPSAPAVIWSGESYLIVWADDFIRLHLARMSRDGVILDAGTAPLVDVAPYAPQLHPVLARGRNSILIVWQHGVIVGLPCTFQCPPPAPDAQVFAARVTPDGKLIDSSFRVSPGASTEFRPALASNGSDFLIVWASAFQNQIGAARVSEDSGAVTVPVVIGSFESRPYALGAGWDGTRWFASWAESGSVKGRFLSAAGVTDGESVVISAATGESTAHVVSNASSVWAFYQRLMTESTNAPRIFFRAVSLGPGRSRAVRR